MSSSTLQDILAGSAPYQMTVQQAIGALKGTIDVSLIQAFTQINAPSSAVTTQVLSGSGNLTGAYQYDVAFVTGMWTINQQNGLGQLITAGNTGGGVSSNAVSPSGNQVQINNIPVGPQGTVARILYRTKANGSSFFFLAQINDNVTTSWTDNVTDANLGSSMPTTNTTGTKFAGDGSLLTNLPIPTDLAKIDTAQTWTAGQTFNQPITSGVASGTAPLVVASSTLVNNLNSQYVNGYSFNQSVKTTDSPTFVSPTFTGPVSKVNNVLTVGNFGVLTSIANTTEQLLNTTNPVDILTITPPVNGNYEAKLYIRCANANTAVTAVVTWTDASGNQRTNTITSNQTLNVDGYSAPTVFINATTSGPIKITVTAGTSGNIYCSASILGV